MSSPPPAPPAPPIRIPDPDRPPAWRLELARGWKIQTGKRGGGSYCQREHNADADA